jgi:large subunit ribosomal protein L15
VSANRERSSVAGGRAPRSGRGAGGPAEETRQEPIGLHNLKPAPGSRKAPKRVGRGEGSGAGKTAGRGQKGWGSRSGAKRRARFEGGQNPIHMRMRKLRGPHMKKSMPFEPFPVKVLAKGSISKALTVHAHGFSKAARERIEAAGGTCQLIEG